jgi:hypothetical protein
MRHRARLGVVGGGGGPAEGGGRSKHFTFLPSSLRPPPPPPQAGGYASIMYFSPRSALDSLASTLLAKLRGRIGSGIAAEAREVGSLVGVVCMSATFQNADHRSRRPAAL